VRVGYDNSANNANTMQYGPVQHDRTHQARALAQSVGIVGY